MKKYYIFYIVMFLSLFIISQVTGQTPALSNITNLAKFSAGNAQAAASNAVTITVATMYGGSLSVSPAPSKYQPMNNLSRYVWTITVTNKGNATANFTARIQATNKNLGGGTWYTHLTNTGNLSGITPGGRASFGLVITNSSAALDGAWMSCLVRVSNSSAGPAAYAYRGVGTNTWYGGFLGVQTNQSKRSNQGNFIYLQHGAQAPSGLTNQAGYLTARISGPVLIISKSISSIVDPSGLYTGDLTRAVPGALVTYRIFVSNGGGAAATNVTIVDTIPTSVVDYVAVTNGSYFSNAGGLIGNKVTFRVYSTSNDRFPKQVSDVLRITVRIK